MVKEISEIIDRAELVLRAAYAGLEMMRLSSGAKKDLGLRNVLTFGRSVTFVVQNLSSKSEVFEEWYKPHQDKLKSDPVFSFFRDARNNLEKQGRLEVSTSAQIKRFGDAEMNALSAEKPPGATGFFIGDQLGGSGWEVPLPNGETIKFYVDMPSDVAVVEQTFAGDLAEKYLGKCDKTALELCERYLAGLSEIVDGAREHFLNQPPAQIYNGNRLPPYIRVVK
ncbi:hypothetical protein GLP43_07970 [Sulfitobacter sp. M39]|uniref:hypothetical protein n=1 Tax=Sulfitobacter sp. M39 TaxID=2675334 RepID=UPI001F26CA57|nr:hypothetical protein [Sulfitobacter sp. M39]MCF7747502.1 hypothetical protein [Sulfitobacter sp. M39]